MEVVLGATEWPFPPRCPQGGALPGRRPTARPHRGKEERLTFESESIDTLSHIQFARWLIYIFIIQAEHRCLKL